MISSCLPHIKLHYLLMQRGSKVESPHIIALTVEKMHCKEWWETIKSAIPTLKIARQYRSLPLRFRMDHRCIILRNYIKSKGSVSLTSSFVVIFSPECLNILYPLLPSGRVDNISLIGIKDNSSVP